MNKELQLDLKKIDPALEAILGANKERFIKTAWLAVRDNNQLLKADRMSLLGAIVKAAELNLELNTPLGLAFIIPYKGKATLQIGYKGFLQLAYLSGMISVFEADVVYDGDEFSYEKGLNPVLRHIPTGDSNKRNPENIKFVYAVCTLKDGNKTFDVMTKGEIEKIRMRSVAGKGDFSPWKTDYEMMAKKTVIKKLCKYIPVGVELQSAVELDSRYEAGIVQAIDPIHPDEVIEQKSLPKDSIKDDQMVKEVSKKMKQLQEKQEA